MKPPKGQHDPNANTPVNEVPQRRPGNPLPKKKEEFYLDEPKQEQVPTREPKIPR